MRRQAQLLWARPDIRPGNLRGNVQARLDALQPWPRASPPFTAHAASETAPGQPSLDGTRAPTHSGPANVGPIDALILAQAGLERLGVHTAKARVHTVGRGAPPVSAAAPGYAHQQHLLSVDSMLPAACQGMVAAACRAGDSQLLHLLSLADDVESRQAAAAERAFLDETDGAAPWAGRPPVAALMQRARAGADDAGREHGAASDGDGSMGDGRVSRRLTRPTGSAGCQDVMRTGSGRARRAWLRSGNSGR
jgi:porphobilinogen deaminase